MYRQFLLPIIFLLFIPYQCNAHTVEQPNEELLIKHLEHIPRIIEDPSLLAELPPDQAEEWVTGRGWIDLDEHFNELLAEAESLLATTNAK